MLKNFTLAIIYCVCLLWSNISPADDVNNIRDYISKNFPHKLQITSEQIQQLTWSLKHTRRTYEMDRRVDQNNIHLEITRPLTRLYCLQLLKNGGKDNYNKFIAAQLTAKVAKPLTFNSFNKLSKHIQRLSDLDYELISTSTILTAVSLSGEAEKLARDVLTVDHIRNDSLEFLAATVRVDANIYPLTAKLIKNNVAAKKMLYVLFPPQTNFRHMLYTEGGIGMFKYLRAMIKLQYIDRNELDLWYAYWIINIAGFRSHVAHDGSLYLTEPVFQAMSKLKSGIDEMLESPNYNPLLTYLEYRAELLGLHSVPTQEKLLLAHFGSLMRLYTAEEGARLRVSFAQLPKNERQQIDRYFTMLLSDSMQLNPTYAPALFGNTLDLNSWDIEQTVKYMVPIYIKAVQLYAQDSANGYIKPGIALSFNKFCAAGNVQKVLKLGTAALAKIVLGVDGEVQPLVS